MTITDIINNLKTGVYAKSLQLNEGASDELIAEVEQAYQIKLPDDVKQFYRFANGFESLDDRDCIFNLLSLKDILYNKEEYNYTHIVIAEYLIYSDTWYLNIDLDNYNQYQIFNGNHYDASVPLTCSFGSFLNRFLDEGLMALYNWLDGIEVNQLKSILEAATAQFRITRVFRITNRGIAVIGKIISGVINAGNVVCINTASSAIIVKIASIEGVRITYNPFQIGLLLDYKETNYDDYFKKLKGQTIDIFQLKK